MITTSLAGSLLVAGCSNQSKDRSPDWTRNTEVLARTANLKPLDAATEKAALERFEAFYSNYSADVIQEGVRGLYADDAWFGDPFHIVEGIDEIEHYFLVMAEPVVACAFTVDSIDQSGIDYFARWTMTLESKAAKGEIIKTIGISHIRFNEEGQVLFQQDYWDSSAMLDRLPIVGYWTRLVKDRIGKGLEQ